jgi:hypothetical protein
MKTSTLIFLCSLICFAACSNPILSEALRSSASIDLDSEDHALIQTESKNKVKSLAYARQNKDTKVENKPSAAAPAKASQPKPSGSAKKPVAVAAAAPAKASQPKPSGQAKKPVAVAAAAPSSKPVAKAMNVKQAEKKSEKPKATAAQKAEFEKKEKNAKKEKKNEKASAPKPAGPTPKNEKSAEANKSTTATTVNVKSAQGTASKRTSGSSFISLSMTVMGMLFALF